CGGARYNKGAMKATPPTADVPHAGSGVQPPDQPGQETTDFEALYQRHSREVWALAYARGMNSDTAMDITQATFLRLWKKLQEGGGRTGEGGENTATAGAGGVGVARTRGEDQAKSDSGRKGTPPPQTMNGVQSRDVPPLENLEREETFGQLRSILQEMPQSDRE